MKYSALLPLLFFLTYGCGPQEPPIKALVDLIPQNASLVIKINDLAALKNGIETNSFLSEIQNGPTFKSAVEKVRFLDLMRPKSPSALAFVATGTGDIEAIFITDASPELIASDSSSVVQITPFDHKGVLLNKYEMDDLSFYGAELSHSSAFSSSPDIVRNSIGNLTKNKTSDALRTLFEIAHNKKPATLYINPKQSDVLIQHLVKEHSNLKLPLFSDWVSFDLLPKPTKLHFNGITLARDSVLNFIDLFANTKPIINATPALAPAKIDALLSYTFNDYTLFAKNQKVFLQDTTISNTLFETVEEIGVLYSNKERSVLLNTHGAEELTEYLNTMKINTIDYQGNQIIELRNLDFLNTTFTPLLQGFKSKFYTVLKNAFIFSNRADNLKEIIRNYNNGTTFDKSEAYSTVEKSLSEASTILYIAKSNALSKLLQKEFTPKFTQELMGAIKTDYTLAAQFITDNNFYHANMTIEKNEKTAGKRGVTPLFQFKLDTTVAHDPQFLSYPSGRNKAVLVQDLKNTLYLISSKGKLLWKKQLDSPIQGKIHEVDIFKNGRFQFAFTTLNRFIILDSKGKEVKGFNTKFNGGGLNPLAVFDYEQNREYRFLVTQGKKTYMYNNKGSIVKGFTYTTAENDIISAPKHVKINSKDYLIFKLNDGSLKILSRVGKVRTKVSEKIDFSENEVYLNKNKFTLTDKKGTLYQIAENGKLTKTNFNLSNGHGMVATANTLVLMNDNILTIRGKKVELELGVYTPPKIFYLANKIYVSVTDLQAQKVYLFDSQAKPISNFPVFGNSTIDLRDIDNDAILEMVVVGENNHIRTYKLK